MELSEDVKTLTIKGDSALQIIDAISKNITKERDRAICEAFALNITRMLNEKGLVPIAHFISDKHFINDNECSTDESYCYSYSTTEKVCFSEIDTIKHDKQIIDNLRKELIESDLTTFSQVIDFLSIKSEELGEQYES